MNEHFDPDSGDLISQLLVGNLDLEETTTQDPIRYIPAAKPHLNLLQSEANGFLLIRSCWSTEIGDEMLR